MKQKFFRRFVLQCIPSLFIALILLSCQSPLPVKGAKVKKTSIEAFVSTVNAGTVKAQESAELAFGAVGRVRKINVKLGDKVKKGEILAELENNDMATSVWRADKNLKRVSNLAAKVVSEADKDMALQEVDLAKMMLEKTLIRAPYDGTITELNLEVGQLSQITAILPKAPIKIVDTMPRYILAEIDEIDLSRVKVGLRARTRILALNTAWIEGYVRKVIPYVISIREQDRTAQIEIDLDENPVITTKELPVGASADVEVVIEKKENAITVPSRCLIGRSNERYLYKFIKNSAVKTPVKVGLTNYDSSEIIEGDVTEGDTVLYPLEDTEFKNNQKVQLLAVTND
jgi:HlyD family secretion protein